MKVELSEREREALSGLVEGKAADMEREARDGWGEVFRERADFWRGILRKLMG